MNQQLIEIVDVSPRDGLQNERLLLDLDQKLELIERGVAAGLHRIEVTSFVHPDRVPQLADAEALVAALPAREAVRYTALALNERGYDRAASAGIREINLVVLASDTFSGRNQGMGTDQSLAIAAELLERGRADDITVTVTIGAAFGCPFEGEVDLERVVRLARHLGDAGAGEITLADTIGVAVPTDIEQRFAAVQAAVAGVSWRAHLHDTRNTGIANAVAAIRSGVRILDATAGGIGGCPFAPRATGNIAIEDLAYTLSRMGLLPIADPELLLDNARWITEVLGIAPAGSLSNAGWFPATDTDMATATATATAGQ